MTARTTAKNEFKGHTDLKKLLFKLDDDNSNFDMAKAVKYIEKKYSIVL
jgi:hypothetical protein